MSSTSGDKSSLKFWQPGVEPKNEEEVNALLNNILYNNGFLSEDDRVYLQQRSQLLSGYENMKYQLSASIEKLSADLYASDSRFLYELIQNADDNRYSRALANRQSPELNITLSKDQLIFETNEDGFTRFNVEAICSISKSTKTSTVEQAYIGEKGIGFKSVFKVADEVHIKSGWYSFLFSFERDTPLCGWSAIQPRPQPLTDMPPRGTRITLRKFHGVDFESLRKDLDQIPYALLLFLRQLRSLKIRVEHDEEIRETHWTRLESGASGFEEIKQLSTITARSATRPSTPTETIIRLFVQRNLIAGLPNDLKRYNTSTKEFINTSQVILAFPLDHKDCPKIEPQFSYAFLPLDKFGFNFLIHADFVTQSSREDVLDSKRNRALLNGVAETFADAVTELCKHKSLRYTWMRFLPDNRISGNFWRELGPLIYDTLRLRSIMEPIDSSGNSIFLPDRNLRTAESLFIVPASFLDAESRPLLRATSSISYLSLNYSREDHPNIKLIGAVELGPSTIIDLIRNDLSLSDSYWRSLQRDEDWQTRMSTQLLDLCNNLAYKLQIMNLNIVALDDNSWTSISSRESILFPSSAKAHIPTDLGLRLLHKDSFSTPQRQKLMLQLGVKYADASVVVKKIFAVHSTSNVPFKSLSAGVAHLKYLFRYGSDKGLSNHWSVVKIFCKQNYFRSSLQTAVFFPNEDDSLGAEELFKKIEHGNCSNPGYSAVFISHLIIDAVPHDMKNDHGQTWLTWLEKTLGVLNRPRLTISKGGFGGGANVAPELKHILQYRSDKLALLLHKHQAEYGYDKLGGTVLQEIADANVLTRNGHLVKLKESILPTLRLRIIADDLQLSNLPFLELGQAFDDEKEKEWDCFDKFGVQINNSLSFHIYCLKALRDTKQHPNAFIQAVKIYKALQAAYTLPDKQFLSKALDWPWICKSGTDGQVTWHTTQQCVWEGPDWLTCKHVLSGVPEWQALKHLGGGAMSIANAKWDDYITELQIMKSNSLIDLTKVCKIYSTLWTEFKDDASGTTLRDTFETNCLVYTPSEGWLAPTMCVWAPKGMQVEGKTCIQSTYESTKGLENFFLKGLQVSKPDLQMHLATLAKLAKKQANPEDIIDVMAYISELKRPEDTLRADLKNLNIFPIRKRNGELSRTSLSVEFAIIDKALYRGLFDDQINILNLSDHDFWRTQNFLIACGLKHRFISEAVTEKTSATDATAYDSKTNELRSKAYAFLRYAKHFRSTRTHESHDQLYDEFKEITVFKSDNITKTLTIEQSGEPFRVPSSKAYIHIEHEGCLNIYVPADARSFKRVWPIDIIPKLKKYLGITDGSGDGVLLQIFNRDDLEILDEDLEKFGVLNIAGVSRDLNQSATFEEDTFSATTASSEPTSSASTPAPSTATGATSSFARSSSGTPIPNDHHARPSLISSIPDPDGVANLLDHAQTNAYKAVLNGVIDAARSAVIKDRYVLPARGNVIRSNSNLQRAFGPAWLNRSRNFKRDRRVGAAGELFIFEMLKHLDLPGFNEENWQSTIRDEVQIHENYADLESFEGRETSDIVYTDTEGHLTKLLCDKRYLTALWRGKKPNYYIEVKTTTEACEEPFYVSAAQYERMENNRLSSSIAGPSIYLVMRVFYLGQPDNIDLQVYVDPSSARTRGELVFTPNNWTVKPNFSTWPGSPGADTNPSGSPPPPGGTNGPSSSGLFGNGNSANHSSSGGLFGGSSSTSQQSSTGFFGASTNTGQTTTRGLFGSASSSSQTTTGSLFGNSASTSQKATGSAFGSHSASSQTATSGLFGNAKSGETLPPSGGLFGSTGSTSSSSKATGIFGNATNPSPWSATKTSNVFGASPPVNLFTASKPSGSGPFGTDGLFSQSTGVSQSAATANITVIWPLFPKTSYVPWEGSAPSTWFVEHEATLEKEPNSTTITNHFQTITHMTDFKRYSFEELRWSDYKIDIGQHLAASKSTFDQVFPSTS